MSSLKADPDALRATQPKFRDVAERVKTAAANLQRVIDAEGPCWGSDKPGTEFAKGYAEPAKKTLEQVGNLSGVLSGLGDNVKTVADQLQQQDQARAATLTQQQSEL
ncbi:WXG100 family type VII secretion target [Nocardia pseudovaccinii]|uniref:WXG100 family type VII secretion target n=1 Tax=Nocardia pseudovaccinii TaxID=189540 RepID=UPI0007A5283A|nr:WXG100 family type VII secretion target [Nocardia pseudovaccinii]